MRKVRTGFDQVREQVISLVSKEECTDEYGIGKKVTGIYMLYVNNFEHEFILPIYIGQAKDVKRRFQDHMTEIMALNRLDKEDYEYCMRSGLYHGSYKTPKIFKYMVDMECSLDDLHMILLEECEEAMLDQKEEEAVKRYDSEFFGFNQLLSVERGRKSREYTESELQSIKYDELQHMSRYNGYGYTDFNFFLLYGTAFLVSSREADPEEVRIRRDLVGRVKPGEDVILYQDNREYFAHTRQEQISAALNYLLPGTEYADFPLRRRTVPVPIPRPKKGKVTLYFVISNSGRSYAAYYYVPEIVKLVAIGSDLYKEYYIKNSSYGRRYYEKDMDPFVVMKKPFQLTTHEEARKMISLSVEFGTGVNDLSFRENMMYGLEEALEEVFSLAADTKGCDLKVNRGKNQLYELLGVLPKEMKKRLDLLS